MNKYVIITPAKNEANYIETLIKSVIDQTIRPLEWIIVDDNSDDDTARIVMDYCKKYSWIKLIRHYDSVKLRESGAKVVRAFYKGFDALKVKNYDFIVKLDADLKLPKNYFEMVAKTFEQYPEVGICGGYCVINKNGKIVKERSHDKHLRGAIKAYKRECFEDIGGIKETLGWDGLDQYMALFKGWEIRILPLQVLQLRETTSHKKNLRLSFKLGFSYYKNGQSFLIAFLSSIARSFSSSIFNGPAFMFGFLWALINRENKNVDDDLSKFIRYIQSKRIIERIEDILKRMFFDLRKF